MFTSLLDSHYSHNPSALQGLISMLIDHYTDDVNKLTSIMDKVERNPEYFSGSDVARASILADAVWDACEIIW